MLIFYTHYPSLFSPFCVNVALFSIFLPSKLHFLFCSLPLLLLFPPNDFGNAVHYTKCILTTNSTFYSGHKALGS